MNLLASLFALVLWGAGAGYWLGRIRPILRTRRWAKTHVALGGPAGRIKSATVIAVLPEVFVPLIWHRVRHGAYPEPERRTAAVPAMVMRREPSTQSKETPDA